MNIAIIEDEKLLASNIEKKLEKNWLSVSVFNDLNSFQSNQNINFDLYIIDISLPDWSWFNLIKWLRNIKKIKNPIIITSWYNDIDKKVYWLNIWADDYLAKPFSPDELIARITALVRRSFKQKKSNFIKYKNYKYDPVNKEMKRWNETIDLNKKELDMLELFLLNKWKLITKWKIISAIRWDYENLWVSDNTINVTISRIRKKLWDDFRLLTIIWNWYKLEK